MKKKYILAVCAAMACTALAGCGQTVENDNKNVQFTASYTQAEKEEAVQTDASTEAEKKEEVTTAVTSATSSEVTTTVSGAVTSEVTAVTTTEEAKETEKVPEETKEPEDTKAPEENNEKPSAGFSESDLTFTYDGHSVTMGKDLADFIAACEPNDTFSSPSCLGNGEDHVFKYDDFTINGYKDNGVNIAVSVDFENSNVSTGKNIKIGSSKDELISAYGSDYTEQGSEYVYRAGKGTLRFRISGDSVAGVSYNFDVDAN